MGMCASGDFFQPKVDKLFDYIEGVKTYIDDILVLIEDIFEKRKMTSEDNILQTARSRLRSYAPKCSFGLNEIPYLGDVITRKGIKYDPKKVKGIMDIGRPTTTTLARALICMVQDFMNMWSRLFHILAPLTKAAIDLKGGK